MPDYGSVPTGPSELYLKLLKGEITPEEYARAAKKRAQEDARQRPPATSAQPKRT
jgi:hypothetical protein